MAWILALLPGNAAAFNECNHCKMSNGPLAQRGFSDKTREALCRMVNKPDDCENHYDPGAHFDRTCTGPTSTPCGDQGALANGLDYINSEIMNANLAARDGRCDDALQHLANALHAAQDLPLHSNYCDGERLPPCAGPALSEDDKATLRNDICFGKRDCPAGLRLRGSMTPHDPGGTCKFPPCPGDDYPHNDASCFPPHHVFPNRCEESAAYDFSRCVILRLEELLRDRQDALDALKNCRPDPPPPPVPPPPGCTGPPCGWTPPAPPPKCFPQPGEGVTSGDPNGKFGPRGATSRGHFRGESGLGYLIAFENEANASAAAHEVLVEDVIDNDVFARQSFRFDYVTIQDRIVLIDPPASAFKKTIDLRPARNALVFCEGSFDTLASIASVRFQTLDPLTGEPSEDPLGGFLPPNQVPPEGEGAFGVSIELDAGIGSGIEVRNQATIRFDSNEPISTPVWSNVTDVLPPSSQVEALVEVMTSAAFEVRWAGGDDASGIEHYDVWVSRDHGAFELWRAGASALSDTFPGISGHYYEFFSLATDSTGNSEAIPAVADASTTVRVELGGTLDMDPNTINLKSMGRWVTAYVELDASCDVGNVLVSTVRLNHTVPAESSIVSVADHDSDGRPDIALKFPRAQVVPVLAPGETVPVRVEGQVAGCPDTVSFAVFDSIRVIRPTITAPVAGNVLPLRYPFRIKWNSPSGYSIDSVTVLYKGGDAGDWSAIAQGIQDVGSCAWVTPDSLVDSAFVAVIAFNGREVLGIDYQGPFRIAAVTAVEPGDVLPSAYVAYPARPNPARTSVQFGFDLPRAGVIRILIYDVSGRLVTTIANKTVQPGRHHVAWDAGSVASGVYFYVLETPGASRRGKLVLLR